MTNLDKALTLAYDRVAATHGLNRADRLALAVAELPAEALANFENAARGHIGGVAWMLEHGAVEF